MLLLVFPLVGMIGGYANITRSKYLFFVSATIAYLALLLGYYLWGICHDRRKFDFRGVIAALSLSQKLLLIFAALAILSALFSPYPQTVWQGSGRYEGLATLLLYISIFMAASTFGQLRPAYLYLLLIAVAANVVIAVMQLAGANPLGLFPAGLNYFDGNVAYSGQFLGTIGNTGMLAAFFCLAIPAFVCYMVRWQSDKKRWLFLPVILGALYVIVCAKVLAGIVGLLAGCLLVIPLLLSRCNWRMAYLIIVILLLICLLLFLYNYQGEIIFFTELSSLLHGQIDDSFGSGRILIWRESLQLVPERPLLGGGPDTLGQRLDLVFTADDGSLIPRQTRVDTAHNDYLNIMVNLGIPALMVYLAALIVSACGWIAQRKQSAVLLLGAAALCYSIQIFFSFSICITAPLFWLFWGMLDYQLKQGRRNESLKNRQRSKNE